MNAFISACLSRNRTVLSILLLTLISGLGAYISIPIEATPDVKIPMLYIMTTHRGISPRDAETQLLRPLEHHLKNIEGVKEMRATAFDGGAYIILEFHAGFNADKARQDVREKVDLAQAEFPLDTDKPSVNEINLGLMPILIVKLSGHLPQRALYNIARNLKDAVEAQVPSVLKAELVGNREEVVEIIVDPMRLESAGVSTGQLVGFFHRNHMMVPAGALRGERGEFAVKVPGLFETVPEIMSMPILANGEATVCLRDVAEVRRTFKDASSIARDQGVPAVSLEISKRTGENIIETIEAVQAIVKEAQKSWPQHLTVAYSQDQSQGIRDMLFF
jgi:multidrug efflux pump